MPFILEMFKNIGAIVALIRAIIDLIREFKAVKEAQKKKEAEQKEARRDEAIEKLKNAETEKDFDDAQDQLVDNKP